MDVTRTALLLTCVFACISRIGYSAGVAKITNKDVDANNGGERHRGVRDCTLSPAGHEYIGHKAVTVSGKTCQAWAVQTPHEHNFNEDHMFPDGCARNACNYCRNPENGWVGLWCYTTDADLRWEKCDVPTCECKLEHSASTYRGLMRSTISGKMCQHWSSQSPHKHKYTADSMFTDGSVELADNFCRNPDPSFATGAWCYTMDPDTKWEMCDVPLCNPRTSFTSPVKTAN